MRNTHSQTSASVGTLATTSRFLMEGYRWRISEEREDRYFLVDADGTDTHLEVLRLHVPNLVATGALIVEKDFYNEDGSVAPRAAANALLSGMTDEERYYCHLMMGFLLPFDKAYRSGRVKLHKKSIEAHFSGPIADANAREYALTQMGWLDRVKVRKGQSSIPHHNPPGASDLKRMYQKFRQPGFHFQDLRKRTDACIHGGKRLDDFVALTTENVILQDHADEKRMNIAAVQRTVGALINDGKPSGHWTTQPPSHKAIKNIIKRLMESRLIGARLGVDAMEDETGSWTGGPHYTQVGEMVYMDCYKTDLIVDLTKRGVWMHLSQKTQDMIKKFQRRVWICVAIDAATRVVLGVSFGLAEDTDLSVRTLRMAVTDKTTFAEVAECDATPPRAVGISGLGTDSGVAFRNARFRTVAYHVTGNAQIGIVGKPNLRGVVERLFRTFHDQFLPYFTGRTFSNVVERGDYDPEVRMTLFLEEFGSMMFRWFTDCYHLQKHRGLRGQPPLNRFNQTIGDTGYAPAMSSDEQRIAFGIDVPRLLTQQGLRYCGVQYNANWLAARYKLNRGEKMRVKIDPENLGRISVLVDGQWATLPGPVEMQGIPLSRWRAHCRTLAAEYGEQATINFETVAKALLSFRKLSAEAFCRAKLEDRSYNSKHIEAADEQIKLRFVYRPKPASHGGPLSLTASMTGAYQTGAKLELPAWDEAGKVMDLERDEAHEVDQDTLDDKLVADNDNVGDDALPNHDDVDVASPTPPTTSQKPKRAPVNTKPMPQVKFGNYKK